MTRRALVVAVAAASLAFPTAVFAHVDVEAGGTPAEVIVTVPNESSTADTVSVSVRLPDNVVIATFPTVAGWRATGTAVPLSPPVQVGAESVTQRVSSVTWTGGTIPPGARASFPLRLRVAPGTSRAGLPFPAVQRYSDGTVVRWIGPPGSEFPAGVLSTPLPVAAAPAAPDTSTTSTATTDTATTTSTGAEAADGGDDGPPVGLIVGIAVAALVVAGIGFVLAKRRKG